MKKILFSLCLLAASWQILAQDPQTPAVTITPGTPTATTVTCAFAMNEACSRYKILLAEPGVVEAYIPMFGASVDAIIDAWGLELTQDTAYTWTEQTPNTRYVVYALAFGDSDSGSAYCTDTLSTAAAGGHGASVITLNVTNIGDTCATTSAIPNQETALFKDLMIEKAAFDTLPTDTVKLWLAEDFYVHYETYNWVWLTLRPNTEYVYCSMGMNADSLWGEVATFPFTTTGPVGISAASDAHISLYPNPATDRLTLCGLRPDAQVTLTDLHGRQLLRQQSSASTLTLSLDGIAPGTYCVQIFNTPAARPIVRKVVVR